MAARISISLRGKDAFIAPESFLSSDFSLYLNTVKAIGGYYVTTPKKGHTLPLVGVQRAMKALSDAGFVPTLSDELKAAAIAEAEAEKKTLGDAEAHVRVMRESLAMRGLKLWPFQEIGQQWLRSKKTALFGDDMGLGKTIQALCAAPPGAPVLVICPAVAKGVWKREAKLWRPDLKPIVLKGRSSFHWPKAGELVIVNWDILPEDLATVKVGKEDEDLFSSETAGTETCQPGTVLIGDEFHVVKNPKTNRNQRWKKIKEAVIEKNGRAWGLTGTPLLNKPPDLWNLLRALDLAEEAFTSWPQFVRLFGGSKGYAGYEWKGTPSEDAAGMLRRVMLARRRESVLQDIPPKIWEVETVTIPEGTMVILNKAAEEAYNKGIRFNDPSVDLSKIQHMMFEQFSAIRAAVADATTGAVVEWVEQFEEAGEPVVVFSAHRKPVEVIGTRPGWAIINGDTPPEKRTAIEDAFQKGQLKGIAATIAAGGVAITLTKSHRCAFVDLDWTPALNKQAEDRLCRFGQTRGVIVTRFVADHPMTVHILENLAQKQAVIEKTVDAARADMPLTREGESLDAILNAPKAAEKRPWTPRTDGAAEPQVAGGGQPAPTQAPRFRSAATPLEEWAARGILLVAALDADKARAQNGVGFSKMDSDFGGKLADSLKTYGKASDKQWIWIVRLAKKYRGQNAEPAPEGT